MNPLTDISEAYKRWRHSRGFGVHSPFAYDLVKCVVSPGNYAYYGYNDIDRALLTPGTDVYNHLQHDAYLLLRLLVFLKTKCLIIYPSKQPVMECAAGSAGVKCGVMTKASLGNAGYDTLIFATNISFPNEIMKAMNAGAAIMVADSGMKLKDSIITAMTDGLILEGRRIMIAIPRRDMVLTHYSMKF